MECVAVSQIHATTLTRACVCLYSLHTAAIWGSVVQLYRRKTPNERPYESPSAKKIIFNNKIESGDLRERVRVFSCAHPDDDDGMDGPLLASVRDLPPSNTHTPRIIIYVCVCAY